MTTIDTLLTLDADDPALRRGIAALLGWRIERNEYRQKFYAHGPDGEFFDFTYWDIGDQMDDVWLKLEAEEIGPCEPLIADWTHSVDAALGLFAADGITWWGIDHRVDYGISHRSGYSVHINGISLAEFEASLPLAICRAWLASKR